MTTRPILTAPDPRLKAVSEPIEKVDDEVRRLADDLIETMYEADGIGLAAIQVGVPKRMLVMDIAQAQGKREPMVFINPKITVLDPTEQGFWEGCLSVPELRGLVYRPRKIRVDYLDRDAKPRTVVAEGFLATVFQHELDHLAGTLFVDRIRYAPGASPISFVEEYARYHVPARVETPGRAPLPVFDCESCNNCLLVCPNGAFHSLDMPPTAMAAGDFQRETQWVVDGGSCNECGNCDTHCPQEGGPWRVKPRWNPEKLAFDAPAASPAQVAAIKAAWGSAKR